MKLKFDIWKTKPGKAIIDGKMELSNSELEEIVLKRYLEMLYSPDEGWEYEARLDETIIFRHTN